MYTKSHILAAQFLAYCFQFAQLAAILVASGSLTVMREEK